MLCATPRPLLLLPTPSLSPQLPLPCHPSQSISEPVMTTTIWWSAPCDYWGDCFQPMTTTKDTLFSDLGLKGPKANNRLSSFREEAVDMPRIFFLTFDHSEGKYIKNVVTIGPVCFCLDVMTIWKPNWACSFSECRIITPLMRMMAFCYQL